jgi:hypothetical protein
MKIHLLKLKVLKTIWFSIKIERETNQEPKTILKNSPVISDITKVILQLILFKNLKTG